MLTTKRLCVIVTGLAALVAAGPSEARAEVFGIQPATGQILRIDPTTGTILANYATPAPITSTQTFGGLTYADDVGQLLYFNRAASTTLYRLNPDTGAVQSTVFGDNFTNAGLSYERGGSTDYLFYAHTNADLHRQTGFGGSTAFFWGPGQPNHGLGGDGFGREFGIYNDGQIHEYNPFVNTGFINGFAAPSGALGLAFDGTYLYASTNLGQLLTLDPNTGALLRSVNVSGGILVELGARPTSAAVPEPATLALLALGSVAMAGWLRRRRTGDTI